MNEIFSSFSLVALAEMGDKTQLLSIILAAKYRSFKPIFFGILIATILNHSIAAYVGKILAEHTSGDVLKYITSALFIILGLWLLVPDKAPEEKLSRNKYGAFVTSFITFFIAEMGDKTQIATVTLGAQSDSVLLIIIGTTLGMIAANIPAILFGKKILEIIPLNFMRVLASVMFIVYGFCNLFIN